MVTVAAAGDYGKPRPAVIVQSDAFPDRHESVVVCQMTSELADAPTFRVTLGPSAENGLHVMSQIMADKPVTIRRERIGRRIGRLTPEEITRLNAALAFVMGLGARRESGLGLPCGDGGARRAWQNQPRIRGAGNRAPRSDTRRAAEGRLFTIIVTD